VGYFIQYITTVRDASSTVVSYVNPLHESRGHLPRYINTLHASPLGRIGLKQQAEALKSTGTYYYLGDGIEARVVFAETRVPLMASAPRPVQATAVGGGRLERHCLVTVGATASFTSLLEEVTKLSFLQFMCDRGYTHLHLQCGNDLDRFSKVADNAAIPNFKLLPFAFVDDLRTEKMVLCRGETRKRQDGVIISHAGKTLSSTSRNLRSVNNCQARELSWMRCGLGHPSSWLLTRP
jgi:hypothetical protein